MADRQKAMEASRATIVAHDLYTVETMAFQLACQRGEFLRAEQHRLNAMAAMESWFDNMATMYRASQT